ncbi:BN159_2729 family protein [Streptomyces sp. M41(2017)]|uniref:BN159_2729 family protein n=1 Tax=Streptomyces sp. M41(2017) TaxID=1955065 RepID=UPI00117E867B|nr:BN159_2729 family protein [Streptomyces sp. M41(2017)]
MTPAPGGRTAVEADLADQLGAFAREFVAELEAQGRLVEVGGAGVLERLRTQVEAWRNGPESYRVAVDTIVEDCGYPSEVAMRIATALNRRGLLPGGEEPEPRPDHGPAALPLVPGARGAIVLHLADRGAGRPSAEAEVEAEGEGGRGDDHDHEHRQRREYGHESGVAGVPEIGCGGGHRKGREKWIGNGTGNGVGQGSAGGDGAEGFAGPEAAHGYAVAAGSEARRGHEIAVGGEEAAAREAPSAADRVHGRAVAPVPEPVPEPVDGQVPRVRPAAARSRTAGWDTASARAVSVAATLQSDHLARLEAMRITADGERVTVAIKATCLADWEYWLDAIGAARNVRTRTAGHAQVAAGTLDGVAVHLTAHGVPELLQEASDAAADPFYLWGRIYDLGVGQTDRSDRVWLSLGRRQDERGMPLLVLRGTAGPPYPLAAIVMAHGPLAPAAPPAAGTDGGDG